MSQPAPLVTLGIGPAGSILYLLTGGLDIGVAVVVAAITVIVPGAGGSGNIGVTIPGATGAGNISVSAPGSGGIGSIIVIVPGS